ncbi:MAG TPA: CopG family antitoxin [Terriglobales bacterium]|nr:CopG family antitoxin [Terriglobales bacterium]
MKATRFEFAPKEARVNMRLPGELLATVKRAADRAGVPYQRFIRQAAKWNAAKPKRRRHSSADQRTRYCGTCPDARTVTRKHPPKRRHRPSERHR